MRCSLSCDDVIDISELSVQVLRRPVRTVAAALLRAQSNRVDELAETLQESFADDGAWCQVGEDLHTITEMSAAEIRLRPSGDGTWHGDFFPGCWNGDLLRQVPAADRHLVAPYIERTAPLNAGMLDVSELMSAAADGGAPAVDLMVREYVDAVDQHYAALDVLHGTIHHQHRGLPGWAEDLIRDEAEEICAAREWIGSAVLAYHHGSAGRRPDTLSGGITFRFTHGSILLTHDELHDRADC